MNGCDQRRFASAWRRSAEQWLCDQRLIQITTLNQQTHQTNHQTGCLLVFMTTVKNRWCAVPTIDLF